MKTSTKIKIINIRIIISLNNLRSYLNHHSQVKIIESKVKIVQQFIWRFIQKFRIIQFRITEFIQRFIIIQNCPFKLPLQLLAS